ncbi:inactive serine/threonine-protein kinase PLK5-like [Aquila chrysaetos chrysaetos]|uniref:inactive serine/threonine-protein kinase PLK5-like n=1 Tax=Aquila chrysaetos chrysaetos TaxID=223781 RepID=UPI00117674B5|nr:inactive serine/threonine-protein kinase PLK5-like [Aquila chrysaetos chrysaetos]
MGVPWGVPTAGHSRAGRMVARGCAGDELPGWFIEDAGSGMLYKRGRLLGEGTFGRCYQLTEVGSGRVYAAKVIPRVRLATVGIGERVEREQELHGRLRHRHIVRLHGHFADSSHVYLLLEYCSRRSLADILRARGRLTEPEVRYYLRQIISGLRYLHGQGIIHRDLKLSNFLVTEKMQVKIGDLGLARREAPAGRRWGALCGTPGYLAPEVLDRKGHGVPSDVWALGCAVYTALTGSPPFEAAHRQELYRRIRAARYPLPPHLSPRARALIAGLLAPEPAARPSLRDVLNHGFFTQGFTPDRLPPHACRSVPVFMGQDPLCRLLRGAATALVRGWPCRERRDPPPCHPGGQPSSPCKGEASSAGPEPCKHPLRKTFISTRNRLKSSH